jgi:hypothetical protein
MLKALIVLPDDFQGVGGHHNGALVCTPAGRHAANAHNKRCCTRCPRFQPAAARCMPMHAVLVESSPAPDPHLAIYSQHESLLLQTRCAVATVTGDKHTPVHVQASNALHAHLSAAVLVDSSWPPTMPDDHSAW